MPPDFIHFLIILYLIYVSDCFVLARSSQILLFSVLRGSKWRVKSTDSTARIGGRFWMLRPLFPPLGTSIRLAFPRCALGGNGFCSVSPLSVSARLDETVRYLDYDAVESVEVRDDALLVNGEFWFKGTKAELAEARNSVESIIRSDDRITAVHQWIRSSYEESWAAKERVSDLEKRTTVLNLFCSIYAVWLLLFLPIAIFRFPPFLLLWAVGAPMLLLHLLCGGLFLRSHAKLLPSDRYARWETFFKMFLCPPMMVRACDPIVDHTGVRGDPVAVMLSCVDEPEWRMHAQRVWRRLIPRQRTGIEPDAAKAMDQYARMYRLVMEEVLTGQGLRVAVFEIDAADMPVGQRYCPCCATVYRNDAELCSDCGGVPLLEGRKR